MAAGHRPVSDRMLFVSSWAGIESGSDQPALGSPTSASTSVSVSVSTSTPSPARNVESARSTSAGPSTNVGTRRIRRQQRPVIGSLDGSGVFVQRNFREFVLGSALILLPSVALDLLATTLAFDRYRTFRGSSFSIPELFGGAKSASSIENLLWYLGLIVSSLVAALVGGYVATLVVHRQLGVPLRISSGYRAMLPRLPALLTAWLIGHCWFPFVALALAAIDSAALRPLLVVGGPVLMLASTMTVCASPAIVIEKLGPIRGLRRSWNLGRASFGVLFGFVTASIIIGSLVQYGVAYLPRLLQATKLLSFGRFGWLIEGAAGQLGRLMSTPLVAVATVLVYLEVRMTMEGMDIVLDADRAFGGQR